MRERVQKAIKIVLGLGLGVFVGRSLWLWQDVNARPELYEANSAPWYTPLLLEGAVLAGLIAAGAVVWWLLSRKGQK